MTKTKLNHIDLNTQQKEQWWRTWFNDIYMDVYAHRDDLEAEKEVQLVQSILSLKDDQILLDLCCGNGRHCRGLKRLGFQNIIGLDYSFPLLRHALLEKPTTCYIRGDMRLLPFASSQLDGVLSFFTSFGYFSTNVENLTVLHELSRVLRPDGVFMLDYLNPNYVRTNLTAKTEKQHGDFTIKEYRMLSPDGERIEKDIIIENWGGYEHRFHESVRLYEFDEMIDMLESADLYVNRVLGDFTGSPYSNDSSRMILFGGKT